MTKPTSDSFKQFAPWLAALLLVVLGAHLWVVQLYGSPLPMWDQWYEADHFYRPWLAGHATWRDFVAPFNEHRILFTRLLDLTLIKLNGRWEPMLQMTVNAFLHAAFAGALAFCLWDFLGRKNGWLVCFLLAPFFALPYAAENAIWPMNSQLYFVNLFGLATLAGLGFGKPGGWRWWLGLAAAFAGLFSMASGLLAPATVGALMILRVLKQRRMEKESLITFACCVAVVGLGLALRVTSNFDASLRAHTLMEFTSALARNLTWPFFRNPEMILLIPLPLAILAALYLRPNFSEPRVAEFLLALGLWSVLQSTALAYGRANYSEEIPASRYMDVLNIFVIASLFAMTLLPRFWPAEGFSKWAGIFLPLIFAGVIFFALCRISQIVADGLLIPTREMNIAAQERIENFWANGNEQEFLQPPTVRPDPRLALRLLRDPQLQTILPAACLPKSTPVTERLTFVAQRLLQSSVVILSSGLLLFICLCGYGLARGALGLPRASLMGFVILLAGLAALGFVWSKHSLQRETVEPQANAPNQATENSDATH